MVFSLLNRNYTIVHIHGASKISFYRKYILFLGIKYLLKRKVIYHIHGGGYHVFEKEASPLGKKFIHHLVNQSNAIICLSENWKDYFMATFKPKKIFILNNIIENPVLKNASNNKNIVQYVFLGKICVEKGVFDLLNIINSNKDFFKDKLKIIFGGDGDTDRLKNYIKKFQLDELVEYVGWVSGEKKQSLLSHSDVFILPSYFEGLPISILEAMSYKMPIISTTVGGIQSIVKNNYNGFLTEPGNLDSILNKMIFFIENPKSIVEFGTNSYKLVQNFLPEKVLQELHLIYDNL